MIPIGDETDFLFFPYNSVEDEFGNPDRLYDSADFADYFRQFIGNGIYPNPSNGLKVESLKSSKVLTVRMGSSFIEGRFYLQKKDFDFSIDSPHPTLNRKDIVICRHDYISRTLQIFYVAGVASPTPLAPSIVRNADTFDLKLCEIFVGSNVAIINQSNITDTRLNSAVCGIVVGIIDQIDVTDIFNQYQDALEIFIEWSKNEQELQKEEWERELQRLILVAREIETGTFTFINNNFDDWSVKLGATKITNFLSNGDILEEYRFTINNNKLSDKLTEFLSNGDIKETVTFLESTIVLNGNTIITRPATATKLTQFNSDGSIMEVLQ